jgi:predicted patatin/cPLA2 family phospholipase
MKLLEKIGLVLEGGGQRTVFNAGVLDYFTEHKMSFSYVIGVSAGASNGLSYISQQHGRNRTVQIDYVNDPRYMGIKKSF